MRTQLGEVPRGVGSTEAEWMEVPGLREGWGVFNGD